MNIVELKPDTEVVFEISAGEENYEFAAHVLECRNNFILTTPVRINDKVLSFSSSSITTNLVWKREGKSPFVWKQIAVTVVAYKKNTVYKVAQSMDGVEMNRRSSYRLYIGLNGVAQIGMNHKALNVIVKDISETGFSFVTEKCMEQSERHSVRLVFEDMNQTIVMNGVVVRELEGHEGQHIYGCVIDLKTQVLSRYINEKQRQRIVQQRGVRTVGGSRADYKKGKNEDKAEVFLQEKTVSIDRDRYSTDLLDEGAKKRSVRMEKYRGLDI